MAVMDTCFMCLPSCVLGITCLLIPDGRDGHMLHVDAIVHTYNLTRCVHLLITLFDDFFSLEASFECVQ